MIKEVIMVAFGGAAGSVARYLVSRAMQTPALLSFPFATLTANILGCLILGFIYGISGRCQHFDPGVRLMLTVGFCGGFTTFSTFMNESVSMMRGDGIMMSALYVGVSVVLGMLAVAAGSYLSKML